MEAQPKPHDSLIHIEKWKFLMEKVIGITQLILFLIIITGLNCDNTIKPQDSQKTIFSLYTGSRDSLSLIDICFESFDTLDELPLITINSSLPDTVEQKEGFYLATFRNIPADSIFSYKFIYHDSIIDSFKVPGEIDSVFCNEKYIPKNSMDAGVDIDASSSYHFAWKTKQKGGYFSFEYRSNINNDPDDDKYATITDTFITIIPENIGLTGSFLLFKLENCNGNMTTLIPDKSSSNVDLYYHIRPSRYTGEIWIDVNDK